MKKILTIIMTAALLTACGGSDKKTTSQAAKPAAPVKVTEAQIHVAEGYDRDRLFIVISKKDETLKVYEAKGDTTLIATFPVCLSRNKGQKEKSGDMRTPESEPGKPFIIKQIQDASDWEHDFGDGRGKILSYGHWFLRLETPFNGIGIHGSTNNEQTVPGRDSEGCIRLKDADIITLKENYARVGMPVIIKAEEQGPLPFER